MVRGTKLQSKKTCHLNFRLPLSWLVAPALLNSFPIAFRPENGPFIVKSCHSEVDDVIDVTGFSRACLAKIVLISPVKHEVFFELGWGVYHHAEV